MPKYNRQSDLAQSRQDRLARALFPLEGSVIRGISPASSKIRPFLGYFEQKLQQGKPTHQEEVLKYCGFEIGGAQAESMIAFLEVLVSLLKKDDSREKGIDTMISDIQDHTGVRKSSNKPPAIVRQGMFSLLGNITMLYNIPPKTSNTELFILAPTNPVIKYDRKPIAHASLPSGWLIGGFGRFVPTEEYELREPYKNPQFYTFPLPKNESESADIDVASVNIATLKETAKVDIKWTELLGAHLIFDGKSRTLQFIMDDHLLTEAFVQAANRSLFRETLLTYRLLFGQDDRSRALFNRHYSNQGSTGECADVLLQELCGSRKSLSESTYDTSIREKASYNTVLDFPFYGPRLLVLQDFTKNWKPHNIGDVWHDKRNPAQWILVWVVLMLGAAAVLVAIIQLGVTMAQLAVAKHAQ
ncbi:MAG: hypothetical protein Q9220_006422 [cf. Caloplaca sp. 1 TL-2023]